MRVWVIPKRCEPSEAQRSAPAAVDKFNLRICWQVFAYIILQLAVIVVDGSAQGALRGIPFGQPLQNALQIAQALGIDDELNRRQRFVIGEDRFQPGERMKLPSSR